MASVFNNFSYLSRLLLVVNRIGRAFLNLREFTTVVERYVFGYDGEQGIEDSSAFAAECKSLFQLVPSLNESSPEEFKKFHDFTVECGHPISSVLVSDNVFCRKCGQALVLEKKRHVVVIYHSERGTYLGCRMTKLCRKCKIYEHYGFWTCDGIKYFDNQCLKNKYLLSTEDTAFDLSLIRQCCSLLIVGAVAFSTFTASYNRRFGYLKRTVESTEVPRKRMKRDTQLEMTELLQQRRAMDRRRLEEGFLLFASLEVIMKHNLPIVRVGYDRNDLAEDVTKHYHGAFVKKWGEHVCDVSGCKSVLVMDGNMKNARQVCLCKNVGELQFSDLHGTVVVGCQDTPCKESRYCSLHEKHATCFKDDMSVQQHQNAEEDSTLIIKILNKKSTRQDNFYEVLWADGRTSWVKLSSLPTKVKESVLKQQTYLHTPQQVKEFGQNRLQLTIADGELKETHEEKTILFKNTGFGVPSIDDDTVTDDDGRKRKINCGTEKCKHKSKNHRTAGNGCSPYLLKRWIMLSQFWAGHPIAEKRARQIDFILNNADCKAQTWFYYDIDHQKHLYLNGLPRDKQNGQRKWAC